MRRPDRFAPLTTGTLVMALLVTVPLAACGGSSHSAAKKQPATTTITTTTS
ncbi:MAG: hypothetical protein JWL73_2383, partial [Actinomycetia bacterium]|nr:hypothetical protein [Actinomycetes bacterium]